MRLKEILSSNKDSKPISKQVVIYGAGNFAQLCATILKEHDYEILYFIDKYKYKLPQSDNDTPIVSIDDERLNDKLKNNISCVLGIFNYTVDLAIIEQDIRAKGFIDIINPLEFHQIFYKSMGDYFWLGNCQKYSEYSQKIYDIYSLLHDDTSKILLENVLEYRLQRKLNIIQSPQNVKTQYFPEDISIDYPNLNFIDCGAFDGDTILKIVHKKIPFHSFIAFEPDIDNIKTLSENTKNIPDIQGFIYPCGVYDISKQIRFSGGTGSSSHINETGDEVIQVVAIDDVLINYEVNFLKMDIEGAEIQALIGAENTIKKHQPILAISAYHRYDDLWTIPTLIHSWKLEYKYFLRLYEFNGFELVYYAIPNRYLTKE